MKLNGQYCYLCGGGGGGEIEKLWTKEYGKKFAEEEKKTAQFFKKRDPNYLKNQRTLAEHRQTWEKMTFRQRLFSICPKKALYVMGVVVLVASIFSTLSFKKEGLFHLQPVFIIKDPINLKH